MKSRSKNLFSDSSTSSFIKKSGLGSNGLTSSLSAMIVFRTGNWSKPTGFQPVNPFRTGRYFSIITVGAVTQEMIKEYIENQNQEKVDEIFKIDE